MRNENQILIIGGGIGGLTAAIALRKAGFEVKVFERATTLSEIGAGITLWTNAIQALGMLDLSDQVIEAGEPIELGELRSWRGEVLVVTPVGNVGRKLGAPSIGLHRAVLQKLLYNQLPEEVVCFGQAYIDTHQTPHEVVARFNNGREERGGLLIGADGIRSTVREKLFGSDSLRYAGYTCYRGITNFNSPMIPSGYAFESWGPGRRFGAIRMGPERIYWFANVNTLPGGSDIDPRQTLCGAFQHWHEPVIDIIGRSANREILRHDVYDREPRKHWGIGRISLLGDAAHAMTPDLGQGACQAIEDAVYLAYFLASQPDRALALRSYEHVRNRRVSPIVRKARFQGWVGQQSSSLLCQVRDLMMRAVPSTIMEMAYESNVKFDAARFKAYRQQH